MLAKINSKKNFQFSIFNFHSIFKFLILNLKFPIFSIVFLLLIYTRFINIGWGLPYPMHPDERNMASAIQSLNCVISNFHECGNPHFFAYGQLPLYLGYLITYFLKFFDGDMGYPISFQEAAVSLRIISAVASILNAIIITKIIKVITKKESYFQSIIPYLIVIFSPYAIQFAHFGTTESILMMFYSAIIYLTLLFIDKKINTLSFVVNSSMLIGLSLATKVSSLIFLIVPFSVLLLHKDSLKLKTSVLMSKNSIIFFTYKLVSKIIDLFTLIWLSLITFIIFSPHNLINFTDFINSMNYESDVAFGKSLVFYTRQFFSTQPFMFQFEKVFPYVLGWPVFLMGLMGLIGANWKDKKINLLRFAFLIYFVPSAVIYAKWSRFMAPVFPIITIFAILFAQNIIFRLNKKLWIPVFAGMTLLLIIPGMAYLHVYQNPDVRFQASEWIYKNIPNNSYILSETANVVDIPLEVSSYKVHQVYQVISFNFYDLDESPELQSKLKNHIEKADYIFVPSRRLFANHSKQKYPILNKYYEGLFSGKLGFEKVAEFESYPEIFQWKFPDEQAEETWTVFDHPVIRIYKRIAKNPKL